MPNPRHERPYFDAWLNRTRRALAPSGRLTEVAHLLARENCGDVREWSLILRNLIDGKSSPTLDLIAQIDRKIAVPRTANTGYPAEENGELPF